MNKKIMLRLPDRFAKAEMYIKFLIQNNLTPTIGLNTKTFNCLIPEGFAFKSKRGVTHVILDQYAIESMDLTDDSINVDIVYFESENEPSKEMRICILYDSVTEIGCLEARCACKFPEGSYNFSISEYRKREKKLKTKRMPL